MASKYINTKNNISFIYCIIPTHKSCFEFVIDKLQRVGTAMCEIIIIFNTNQTTCGS